MDCHGGFFDALQAATVFLNGMTCTVHLSRTSFATQLGYQFVELADAGSTERMALRFKTAGGIHRQTSAEGELAPLCRRAALAECQARGARGVVISQGAGPVLVASGTETRWLHPPAVPVVNPIGSGDCLAAGLAWGLARGLSLPESARWGVAAAADNVSQLDPADLAAPRVRALFDQVRVEPSSPGNEPVA